jgi:putative thioredoxin
LKWSPVGRSFCLIMNQNVPHIFDVSEQDFAARVLQKSRELPVLVDFWAPWCAPCRALTPMLARLTEAYAGKFALAKVNTDVEQGLAARYSVRGLPTVKFFRHGDVVDEFVGLQPEATIRRMIEQHLPRPSEPLVRQALNARAGGSLEEALALLEQALSIDSDDAIRLLLAEVNFQAGRLEEAEGLLAALSAQAKLEPGARALAGRLEFSHIAAEAPPKAELEQTLSGHPQDCLARTQLSAHQVLAQDYEGALTQLLEIVKQSRKVGGETARKHMLAVFDILGGKGPLVSKYRSLLSTALH